MKRFSPRNILYVVWFLVYYLVMSLCFGAQKESFLIVGIIYLVFILIAFTPIAEKMMRRLEGARELRTAKEKDRLQPLFEEVYESALQENPSLFKNIRLFTEDSLDINAFAMGKKTLAITKGSAELLTDEELKGVIAHELGHFAHGDTMALLVMTVGNMIFSLFYKLLKLIANILYPLFASRDGTFIIKGVWWIVNTIINFFMFIGDLILMPISRANEFMADRFAYDCGYGNELISALDKMDTLYKKEKLRFRDYLRSTHPSITKRIEKLETIEVEQSIEAM